MNNYGIKPQVITNIPIDCKEMLFYMYLPIKMIGSMEFRLPEQLKVFQPLIDLVIKHEGEKLKDKLVYITAKHIYASPDNVGNRPGYHSDGYGTDDVNYIWTNKFPTVFCIQNFNLSEDCSTSLTQMKEQALKTNEITFPVNTLLRLDELNVHRTPDIEVGGMRTFVKISISTEKYNLVGNSHNYLFDYDWKMFDRCEIRNHPTLLESDSIKYE